MSPWSKVHISIHPSTTNNWNRQKEETERGSHSKHRHPKSVIGLKSPRSTFQRGLGLDRSQRASVVIKLAHISKKSMVCDPWRGVSRGELPDSDPGREELSWGRSMAGLAESMLSRGLWSPAMEPDLWGVDDPDLKPTASMISSEGHKQRTITSPLNMAVVDEYIMFFTVSQKNKWINCSSLLCQQLTISFGIQVHLQYATSYSFHWLNVC